MATVPVWVFGAILGVVAAISPVEVVQAQQAPWKRQLQQHSHLSSALLQCAALAARSGESHQDKAAGLARKALPHAKIVANEILTDSDDKRRLGPLGPFLFEQPADFWVGTLFAEADRQVEGFLIRASESRQTMDNWEARRELDASVEFSRRNCVLIGR